MTRYPKVIGSTDVYSRKHIDREFDRLERLRVHDKQSLRELRADVASLKQMLSAVLIEQK